MHVRTVSEIAPSFISLFHVWICFNLLKFLMASREKSWMHGSQWFLWLIDRTVSVLSCWCQISSHHYQIIIVNKFLRWLEISEWFEFELLMLNVKDFWVYLSSTMAMFQYMTQSEVYLLKNYKFESFCDNNIFSQSYLRKKYTVLRFLCERSEAFLHQDMSKWFRFFPSLTSLFHLFKSNFLVT